MWLVTAHILECYIFLFPAVEPGPKLVKSLSVSLFSPIQSEK